ncbi:unnamed protein product [Rotaria magnacalcarata]|uniref:PET hydrolase/cutinase-like domain-containing protein n=2 Tax=Rotaria magnacalcarata TaxID=392030 RepID=A0A816ZRW3_9BILA|nr:unnamed protein product [Rotaria magnacalcarata]
MVLSLLVIEYFLNITLKKILFAVPHSSHYTLTSHNDHLFWLPSDRNAIEATSIPCMLFSPIQEAQFFLIWCHGNGEDISTRYKQHVIVSQELQAHILVFEYPSYGLSKGKISSLSEALVDAHAQRAYSFVRDKIQWPTDRIIIYGHSLGSGPASHIASTQSVGGLILQSPYMSIISFWDNNKAMQRITCPTLFIHGQLDTVIPFNHSQILFNSLNHTNKKEFVMLANDDHSSISVPVILMHTKAFLNKYIQQITKPMPAVKLNQFLENLKH